MIFLFLLRVKVVFCLIMFTDNWKVVDLEIYINVVSRFFKIKRIIFSSFTAFTIFLAQNMIHRRGEG